MYIREYFTKATVSFIEEVEQQGEGDSMGCGILIAPFVRWLVG